jgi:C4-dicarboxylate-specific signal transduction histidine kinase
MIQFSGFQDYLEQEHLERENARLRAELERARSELAHLARVSSLGTLAAAIAHEVTQPLTGIIINAGTCAAMLGTDPPNMMCAGDAARRIMRDAHRACEVVARLRALFDKRARTLEFVDLNEAAREVASLSSSELCRSGIILRQEYTDPLPAVTGDRVQLQQVILNLLLNATDAMRAIEDRPRLLTIRTQPDGPDHVSLSVRDAGPGFEPQRVEKFFEPFYTTKRDGMGIGLSVSRSIVESHHGRLWGTLNEGPGATFAFAIPRAPGPHFGPTSKDQYPVLE